MWCRRELTVVFCQACAATAWGGPGSFTEKRARKLLPQAASIDPHMPSMVVQLGTKITPRDLERALFPPSGR